MPALIIDKFNDYFVIQSMAYGIDIWKPAIVKALQQVFNPKGIYERNDVPVKNWRTYNSKKGFYQNRLIPISPSLRTVEVLCRFSQRSEDWLFSRPAG